MKLTVAIKPDRDEDSNDPKRHGILGGMMESLTWDEYYNQYNEKGKPYIQAIKDYIIDNDMVGMPGMEFNVDENCFVFNDGTIYGFSHRGWGDMMQAIVGKEGEDYRWYAWDRVKKESHWLTFIRSLYSVITIFRFFLMKIGFKKKESK